LKTKKGVLIISICAILLIGVGITLAVVFGKGGGNNQPGPTATVQHMTYLSVDFSAPAGFYDEAFDLTLKSTKPGTTVRYTLDGTVPTDSSKQFSGPIRIGDQGGDGIDPVSLTMVRAAVFSGSEIQDGVSTATYIVGANIQDRYTTPVISLVTDENNLTDPEAGLFTNVQKGIEGEKPIHVEFFKEDGSQELSVDGGVRLYFGTYMDQEPKSLRLFARKTYSTDGRFSYAFIPDYRGEFGSRTLIGGYNTFLLRNPAQDFGSSMLRDSFAQRLARNLLIDYQEYRPVVVYLNGQYYGLMDFREDMSDDYVQSHYSIPKENVAVVNTSLNDSGNPEYVLDTGNSADLTDFNAMLDFISTSDMKDQNLYGQASNWLNMDSFVKYAAYEIYIGNTSWPNDNVKAWKYNALDSDVNAEDGYDGKWRFVMKNVDSSFGLTKSWDYDNLTDVLNADNLKIGSVLKSLLQNDEFKEKFIQSFRSIINEAAKPEYGNELLSQMELGISGEIQRMYEKYNKGSLDAWDANVTVIRDYLNNRPAAMMNILRTEFGSGYDGLSSMSTLKVDKPENGSVIVGTVKLFQTGDETVWSGDYFTNIPVEIKCIPDDGYTLKGYNIDGVEQEPDGRFLIASSGEISPVFEKKPDYVNPLDDVKGIVINELLDSAIDDSYDWIELYNTSDKAVNLRGCFLSDDTTYLAKWQFPAFDVGPGEFIVVKCNKLDSSDLSKKDFNTNFSLKSYETVTLTYIDGITVLDSVNLGYLDKNVTFGRYPDGKALITLNEPTPGAPNIYRPYNFYVEDCFKNRVLAEGKLANVGISPFYKDNVVYIKASDLQQVFGKNIDTGYQVTTIDGTDYITAEDICQMEGLGYSYINAINSIVFYIV
jgi:hypothetical protein